MGVYIYGSTYTGYTYTDGMRRAYTTLIDQPSRSSRICRIAIAQKRGERTGKPDARSPSVVTPVGQTWLGDEHVVRAHIPHASTTVSG